MLLGVIPMFCFEILRIFEENRKKEKLENLALSGSYAAASIYAAAWLPRRDEAKGPICPPGYATA